MMKKLLFLIVVASMCMSCSTQKQTASIRVNESHNGLNSLDWDGIYRGMLPCADCEGIQTTVYLNRNLTYTLETRYLGKSDSVFRETGKIIWNASGSQISLASSGNSQATRYAVGENTLTQLDRSGNMITGNFAYMYTLSKSNYVIYEKYWKLVELNGKAVPSGNAPGREIHLIFKENNRVTGSAGCNTLTGGFSVAGMNRIQISKVATTMMACLNMDLERQFLNVLEQADSYYIVNDELILNRGRMAPLARFKAVSMK